MAEEISSLLRRSLGHLAEDVPGSYRLMLDTLGPLVIALDVDGERFSMSGGGDLVISEDRTDTADVRISTSRPAIVDVLEARTTLAQAVEAGAVYVRGRLDAVERAHDTLVAYVHAAVRAPTQLNLLSALKAGRA